MLNGLHMRPLTGRLELVITEDDVDDLWQLKNLEAIMSPYREQTRTIDAQMLEALEGP